MAAATNFLDAVLTIREAKTYAIRWAIVKVNELHFFEVIYEPDCLHLFQCWEVRYSRGRNLSMTQLVDDYKKMLGSNSRQSLCFTKRDCNKAAHSLTYMTFTSLDFLLD